MTKRYSKTLRALCLPALMLTTLGGCLQSDASAEAWTVALGPHVDNLTIAIAEAGDCAPDAVVQAAGELVKVYDAISFAECD